MINNEAIQHLLATLDPSTPAPELQVCAGEKKTTPHVCLHVHYVKAKTHTDESPGKAEEANKKMRICLTVESVYGKEISN